MKMLCSVKLSPHRYETQEGYLVCKDCIIARTGKQTYLKSELFGAKEGEDEYIEVDRSEKEVFDEKTMASFEGKPLTIEHPNESVSPENYKQLAVGNVHNVHRGVFEGQDVMYADINVYDAEAIDLIKSGEMVELSCGYDCDITDGPNPEQINIRGNHIALCEAGRAGIARIQDSKPSLKWGVKPIIDEKEDKSRFPRIKNILQTKVVEDYNNDELPETAEKWISKMIMYGVPNSLGTYLLKEEKEFIREEGKKIYENFKINWKDSISIIKDSVQRGTLIQEFGRYGEQYKVVKIEGNVLYCEELVTKKNTLFKRDKENIDWAVINKSQIHDSITIESWDMVLKSDKPWHMVLNKIEEHIHNKYGYVKSIEELKKKAEKGERMLQCIDLEYANVGNTDISKMSIGPFDSEEDAKKFYETELKDIIEKYKTDKSENISWDLVKKTKTYDESPVNKDFMSRFYNLYNELSDYFDEYYKRVSTEAKEYDDSIKIRIFDINDELNWELTKDAIRKFANKYNININRFGFENGWYEYNEPIKHTYTVILDIPKEEEEIKDSTESHYVIALEGAKNESYWFGENDKPTNNINEAKKFKTYEEADSFRKTSCKGAVQEIQDSEEENYIVEGKSKGRIFQHKHELLKSAQDDFDKMKAIILQEESKDGEYVELWDIKNNKMIDSFKPNEIIHDSFNAKDPEEIKKVEELINKTKHGKISESWGSLTIDFDDKTEMRKAAKILNRLYDIEMFTEDEDELYIAIYSKFDKPYTGSDIIEDSDNWFGYNLRKGKPADDFKQYLKDRGLYFEPSENGEFIHFEIKNADDDVKKEIAAINKHYQEVGLFDSYSKRFYTNAIKELNKKLEKLERNELLDSNQEDYEIQKSKLIKEIKSQIDEYQKKLDELE